MITQRFKRCSVFAALVVWALLLAVPSVSYARIGGALAGAAKAKAAEALTNGVMNELEKRFTSMVANRPISEEAKADIVKKLTEMARPIVKKFIDDAMGGSLPNVKALTETVLKEVLPQVDGLVAAARSAPPAPAAVAVAPPPPPAAHGAPVMSAPPASQGQAVVLPPPAPRQIILTPVSWTVDNEAAWIEVVNNIRTGGDRHAHTVTITGDISVPVYGGNTFGSVKHLVVNLSGSGTISLSNSGNLLRIGNGQTVNVEDLTLRGRDDNNSPLVVIDSGGTFSMNGGASITGNTVHGNGGGVFVSGGRFTMTDNAAVSGNTATGSGGGVFVCTGGFGMQDNAKVSDNTANGGGGGVYVNDGRFVMINSSSVTGNTVWLGGGVYVGVNGNFIMQGEASVSGNTANQQGGGVYSVGQATLRGRAKVSGNTANQHGGGVYFAGRAFAMEDSASVSRNTAGMSGGGVYALNTFTMQDNASVAGNTASKGSGGGVYFAGKTIAKTGGIIGGGNTDLPQVLRNTAAARGHAVYGGGKWRNATIGPAVDLSSYGFWLNEAE